MRFFRNIFLSLLLTFSLVGNSQVLGDKRLKVTDGFPTWSLLNFAFEAESLFPPNTAPIGFEFGDDGAKLISNLISTAKLYTHNTHGYDITILEHDNTVTAGTGFSFYGIQFYNDGLNILLMDETNIYQYSLTTAYSLLTATYDSVSFVLPVSPAIFYDMWWSYDGTKMYLSSGIIYQYTASNPFDITSLSSDGDSGALSGQSNLRGMVASPDGTVMFTIAETTPFIIKEWSLTTPFDVTGTVTATGNELSLTGLGAAPRGLRVNFSGKIISYISISQDKIYTFWDENASVPNTITDLSLTTAYKQHLKVNWSVPSSENSIKHYELYVDGVLNAMVYTNSGFVGGLPASTSYDVTVYSVDVFDNKSLVSNTLTTSTNTTVLYSNIVAYYAFDNDVTDATGVHDGAATDITFGTGKSNESAIFNGSTSNVEVPDSDDFSFVTGSVDEPFSVSTFIKFDTSSNPLGVIVSKWDGTNIEWAVFQNGNTILFRQYKEGGTSAWIGVFGKNTWETGVWYHLVCTSDGSESDSGLKIYFNSVDVPLTASSSGSYTNMSNTISVLNIGKVGVNEFPGQLDGLSIWNKELSQSGINEIMLIQISGVELY